MLFLMPAVCMRHSVCEREGRGVGGRGKGGGEWEDVACLCIFIHTAML